MSIEFYKHRILFDCRANTAKKTVTYTPFWTSPFHCHSLPHPETGSIIFVLLLGLHFHAYPDSSASEPVQEERPKLINSFKLRLQWQIVA